MAELADTLTPTEDDRLAQAEAMVRSYCGWHIAPNRDDTLTLDGDGGTVLVLPSLNVTEVLSVTVQGIVLDPTDYAWSQAGFITRVPSYANSWNTGYTSWSDGEWSGGWYWWWPDAPRSIVVELTHGYDPVPPEVSAVVQAIAGRLVDNPTGLEQQTVGPFTEKYGGAGSALGSAELGVLSRYRLPGRP
jgi:hypothetical protein